jgi:predicted Fe-S protein YdhL (DUF1289 family)
MPRDVERPSAVSFTRTPEEKAEWAALTDEERDEVTLIEEGVRGRWTVRRTFALR